MTMMMMMMMTEVTTSRQTETTTQFTGCTNINQQTDTGLTSTFC